MQGFILLIMFWFMCFMTIMLLWYYTNKSFVRCRKKLSSFECGFDGVLKTRVFISVRFCYFLVLFLIFDVELVLLLQLAFTPMVEVWKYILAFLLILAFTLLEFFYGLFKWSG